MAIKTGWTVAHECGHEQDHDLADKRASERAGSARWLAKKDCSDCWRASRDKEAGKEKEAWLAERRSEEAQQIESWEQKSEMPRLDGSDKAVEWGRRVRFDLLSAAYDCVDTDDEFLTGVEGPARKITSASWWIDQRDTEPEDVAELVTDATADPSAETGSENPY